MSTINKLVAANTRFGFKLFAELVKRDAGKNIFISPSSVAFALAMTYNGASGETQRAMARTLELYRMSLENVNRANAALRETLERLDPQVRLTIANALWARQDITFKPDFIKRNQEFYAADLSSLPNDPAVINGWVHHKTNGRIKTILDRIDPLTILLLINAIYFKGIWSVQFDTAKTRDGEFTLSDGRHKDHPMMSQSGRYPCYRGKGFQAVSLPYGTGRLSMYIFLPDKDSSLAEFQKNLTAENWETWISGFHEARGSIVLPRFKLEYEANLNDALGALGMAVAFDATHADFSKLCPIPPTPNVCIGLVKHKTFVEVNEEGTEAAAVTVVGLRALSAEMPFNLVVDRPFFCAIRDNETGSILFMGSIVDPQ